MAESMHTPGPWLLDGHNLSAVIRCLRPKGHPEATHVCGDYEQIATAQGRNWAPNARLIAAAPEMLEALKNFVAPYAHLTKRQLEACAERETYGRVSPHIAVSVLSARAAIAKAEGR